MQSSMGDKPASIFFLNEAMKQIRQRIAANPFLPELPAALVWLLAQTHTSDAALRPAKLAKRHEGLSNARIDIHVHSHGLI